MRSKDNIPTKLLFLAAIPSGFVPMRFPLLRFSWLVSAVFTRCRPRVELFEHRVPLRLESFE